MNPWRPADLEAMFDEFQSVVDRMQRLTAELAKACASARSADGLVTATVSSRGELIGLLIDPSTIGRKAASELAARVVEAASEAAQVVRQRCTARVADVVPPRLRELIRPDGGLDSQGLLARMAGDEPGSVVSSR